MTTEEKMLAILEKQEKDRQTGKIIGGTLALIVIVPIALITIAAMVSVASV